MRQPHILLVNLPQNVLEIERRWAIEVGRPTRNGTEAFVADARTAEWWQKPGAPKRREVESPVPYLHIAGNHWMHVRST